MTFWPRTLLWRSALLIALVLAVAHLAWLQIFRVSEREPRAHQVASQIASIVNVTRAALVTAQPSRRFELLGELAGREGIEIHLAEAGETVAPLPDRPLLQLIAEDLRRQLGPDTLFTMSRNDAPGAWVSFLIDEDRYWVMVPQSRLERAEPLRWIGWGALVLALAVAGAVLIVARVNRPLRELTRAAGQMGRGQTPEPVSESGPSEVSTLSRAFNQMTADLKRLDDERALLLAGVSHDLRTPLARIRLGLEMLDDKGDGALKDGMIQDIEDIDAAIGQFLDFARVTNPEAATADGDLGAIVRDVTARYASLGKAVTLAETPTPPVALRPAAVQRLVVNLIENALRHGSGAVDVAAGKGDACVFVEVLDRGPGIPPEETARMLQPFTRLESARTGAGTGLGLAIVDRIARLHGGNVALLPREGGGLRARVEFPLARPGA